MEKSRDRLKEILTTAVVIFLSVLLFIARFVISAIPSEDYPWFTPIIISLFIIASIGYVIYIIFFSKESIYGKRRLEKRLKAKKVSKEETLRNMFKSNDGRKQSLQNKKPDRVVTLAFVAIFVCLAIGSFYWFEYRPTEIKKSCAYTTFTVPEVKAISREDAESSKLANTQCKEQASTVLEEALTGDLGNYYQWQENQSMNLEAIDAWIVESECDRRYPIKEETEYQPQREDRRDATEEEYNDCLRRSGLL